MSKSKIMTQAVGAADPGKAARVEKERARLMALFAGADPNQLDFIRDAVQQVAWLGITILELQSEIDLRGTVVPFQNGREQNGLQANPACKVLKDYQQLYNTQFRALLPVLPDRPRRPGKLSEFMNDYAEVAAQFNCDDLPLDLTNV